MSERYFEYGGHWLIRRKDTPNFHIYWCKPGTRRVRRKSTNTEDLELAKQRLIEFVHTRQRPTEQDPENVSIHDALNEYVEYTLNGKASQGRSRHWVSHWNEYLEVTGVDFVNELTIDRIDDYLGWRRRCAELQGLSLSNGTLNRELDVLRGALGAFVKRGYLSRAPYIKKLPSPPPRDRFLSPDEVKRLLDECHEAHLRLFVELSLHTLQRPSAVLGLRWSQIDLEWNRIDFLPAGDIQTNKRRPIVPVNRRMRELLEVARSHAESGNVIEYKGRPVRSVKKSFKRACERAGLKRVVPYTLRHTGATLLAASGVDLRQISGMLGHTHMRTTELYTKHRPEFLSDASEGLDRLFGDAVRGDEQHSSSQVRAKRAPERGYPQVWKTADTVA